MKPLGLKPVFTVGIVLFLATGCRPSGDSTSQPASEARLETQSSGESWHSDTRAPAGRNALQNGWMSIAEDVRLDASGRLVHAETRARGEAPNSLETKVTFDPPSRTVVVEREGKRTEWSVPGDEPWVLAPVTAPAGTTVPTPLVAWTTYRASRDAQWVRLILPLEQKSYVVPRDQYVVGGTVIVGDQAVDVDAHFVRSIQLGGVELARSALGAAFKFNGG